MYEVYKSTYRMQTRKVVLYLHAWVQTDLPRASTMKNDVVASRLPKGPAYPFNTPKASSLVEQVHTFSSLRCDWLPHRV